MPRGCTRFCLTVSERTTSPGPGGSDRGAGPGTEGRPRAGVCHSVRRQSLSELGEPSFLSLGASSRSKVVDSAKCAEFALKVAGGERGDGVKLSF